MRTEGRLALRATRACALAVFVVYCGWNLYWLPTLRVPPSLFLALTGYPSPTTGCVRSLQALARGEMLESLRANPLTIVYLGLLMTSAGVLANQARRHGRLHLPHGLAPAWFLALFVGWVAKLLGSQRFW